MNSRDSFAVYNYRERRRGVFSGMKVVTPTADIKAASSWASGNSAAGRALFMSAGDSGDWSWLTVHKKTLTGAHRVY